MLETWYFFMWYMLVIVSILFCISGLDDLFFDIFYWYRYFWRLWKTRRYKPLTYEVLAQKKEYRIAILTPCWHEANVIDVMLKHNCYAIDYQHYDIFVGVYPNDPDTIASVESVAKLNEHVHCVVGKHDGPTNKASNLNQIYEFIVKYEIEHQIQYDIFVLHDSEDLIHPLSFKVYNYLIDRADMIQVPIFPLEPSVFNFTHWIYNDEFAEIHTKDIIVREAIKGLVPSAGVGTAFSRRAIETLKIAREGLPFAMTTLTEDYNTALKLRTENLKQFFVTQRILRQQWKKKFGFFGPYELKNVREFVATRALFPMEYIKAVRQKARWILGISIQEWAYTGWSGNIATLYTLIHDRKSVFTHFINVLGYVVFLFWLVYSIIAFDRPNYPSLQEQLNLHPWVWYMILLSSVIMCERIIQRMIAVWRVYGTLGAITSIPRVFYGNIVNIHALFRAYKQFLTSAKSKAPAKWDKTDHHFPGSHVLIDYKKKLGDLIIENRIISQEQLHKLLNEQHDTGKQLGKLLKEHNYLTESELTKLLAKQYELPTISVDELIILKEDEIPNLAIKDYRWLIKNHCYPFSYDGGIDALSIAIEDPSNERLLKRLKHRLRRYHLRFALLTKISH